MFFKPDPQHATKSDIRDLNADPIIRWQHTYYLFIGPAMAFLFPMLVAGLCWNDWVGGFFFCPNMLCIRSKGLLPLLLVVKSLGARLNLAQPL